MMKAVQLLEKAKPYNTEKIEEVEPDNEFEIAALQYFKDSIKTFTNLNRALPEVLCQVTAMDVVTKTLANEIDSIKAAVLKRDERTKVNIADLSLVPVLVLAYHYRKFTKWRKKIEIN